jgi:hypothetical protein
VGTKVGYAIELKKTQKNSIFFNFVFDALIVEP